MRPYQLVNIIFIITALLLAYLHRTIDISGWWLFLAIFVYINLMVLGAIYIQWNFFIPSYNKGKQSKQIALTFDDGPTKETIDILDILKEQKVPGAFFLIGKNAAENISLVKRLHEEGHLLGNHSYNHGFNFDWQSSAKMAEELKQTNDTISREIGKKPLCFRPPYGVTNPNLARAVKKVKMSSIGWNVRSFDTTAKDPRQLMEKITSQLKGGDIVLLHDKVALTKEILTDLIAKCREKGFTFVRVDQLLGIPAYE